MEWLVGSGRIELIREVNDQTGLFHSTVVDKYIDLAQRGRFKQHVWGLYVLSHWIKRELL
jgi:asparagine synthase (glutamine-hydrolysing)